ncbi:MAG: glycoside hydrolase family 43 protein, partial [Nocardioidaceae bacterium]
MLSAPRQARTAAAVALVVLAALLTPSPPPAGAAVGSDDFRAGRVYRGDFPDPSVMRLGSTYYAYATNTGGKLLPAMSSRDLRTWRARPSRSGRWWRNDALAGAPRWARRHYARGKWRVSTWAPSVAKVGGRYIAAYAAPVSTSPRRMCISLAYAKAPMGPFVDRSRRPFVCARNQGSIDPEIYRDASGVPYLLWKNEGVPRREPTRIWTRRLNRTATAPAAGSRPVNLLTTALGWEGNVVENPSMARAAGRTYLVYSANRYTTAAYAIGYAVCRSAVGPCRRPSRRPLLATGGSVAGPGGPDLFRDGRGRLRMAYAAWDRGRVGYPRSAAC